MGAFGIKYLPRTAIKVQVLANLVPEFTECPKETWPEESRVSEAWVSTCKLYVDGAANQKGSIVGIILISPEKITIEKSLRLGFPATNNEAKFKALLAGMIMVKKLGGGAIEIFSNSRIVVGQINADFKARDQRMQGFLDKIR